MTPAVSIGLLVERTERTETEHNQRSTGVGVVDLVSQTGATNNEKTQVVTSQIIMNLSGSMHALHERRVLNRRINGTIDKNDEKKSATSKTTEDEQ